MTAVLTILAMTAAWYGWLGIAYFLRAYHRGGAMDDRHYLAICGAFALLFTVGVGSLTAWLTERRTRKYRRSHDPRDWMSRYRQWWATK